jgi:hypothetical protein
MGSAYSAYFFYSPILCFLRTMIVLRILRILAEIVPGGKLSILWALGVAARPSAELPLHLWLTRILGTARPSGWPPCATSCYDFFVFCVFLCVFLCVIFAYFFAYYFVYLAYFAYFNAYFDFFCVFFCVFIAYLSAFLRFLHILMRILCILRFLCLFICIF